MKVLYSLILASVMLAAFTSASAQKSGAAVQRLSAAVDGAGGKVYIRVTNGDGSNAFRGSAQVRFDGSASSTEAPRISLELAPGETRGFPVAATASPGDQYMLTIYNQDGAVVLFQAAPVGQGSRPDVQSARPVRPAGADEVSVRPLLYRASHYSEAEIPVPDEPNPLVLIFEVTATAPLDNASLTIKAKDFERRQPVTVRNRARVEFKLPDEQGERNLRYLLADASGKVRASGEVDLDQLMRAESITVGGFTFDRPAYAPGDTARVVIELLGETSRSYRLEVTIKEGENLVYRDTRKGVQPRQEFVFELPAEVKGTLAFGYKVFGTQTGTLFDFGLREISLSDTSPKQDAGGKSRIAP
jgi:hypothetical protein